MSTPNRHTRDTAAAAAGARPVNTYERRAGVESSDIAFDKPDEKVDVAAGLASGTGMALVDTAAGIESEPPTGKVAEALAAEKFMAEPVEITLMSPGSEDEHQFVEVTVNGLYRCLVRSDELVHVIPRSHLAVIAGAKVQRLVQKKITQSDGSMGYSEKAVLQQLYPFSVISDQNPKGGAWLRQIIARG